MYSVHCTVHTVYWVYNVYYTDQTVQDLFFTIKFNYRTHAQDIRLEKNLLNSLRFRTYKWGKHTIVLKPMQSVDKKAVLLKLPLT